jgi:hypothetical protein
MPLITAADILVLRHRVCWVDVLADLRAAGISGYRLSEIMLISRSTVQGWEAGSEPSHSYGTAILEVHTRFCGAERTKTRITESVIIA